jgi:hypothetical protein
MKIPCIEGTFNLKSPVKMQISAGRELLYPPHGSK